MRADEARARDPARRSLSPVLRARQGLRGPRRICRVMALLRARQRAEARRKPLPAGDHREQHAAADRRSARGSSLRARAGVGAADPDPIFILGLPRAGSTLLEQILASHSARRGHAGTLRHPAHRARPAGPRAGPRQSALPGRARDDRRREDFLRLGEKYLHRHARLPAPASRTSSTRCRTTSGTSA